MRRGHDNAADRTALAHVVVGVTDQVQRNAMGQEGAEALAGCAIALNMYGVVGQALVSVASGYAARQHCAYATVAVAHRRNEGDFLTAFVGGLAAVDQLMIQCMA